MGACSTLPLAPELGVHLDLDDRRTPPLSIDEGKRTNGGCRLFTGNRRTSH
jgi:hypothetical protein